MKLVIAITGASGMIYTRNLLHYCKDKFEVHFIGDIKLRKDVTI